VIAPYVNGKHCRRHAPTVSVSPYSSCTGRVMAKYPVCSAWPQEAHEAISDWIQPASASAIPFVANYMRTGWAKKTKPRDTQHVTSSNAGRFSQFLYCHTLQEICNKVIIYLKIGLQLLGLPATRQDSGEFIFQQDCHSAQGTLVSWHKYFTR